MAYTHTHRERHIDDYADTNIGMRAVLDINMDGRYISPHTHIYTYYTHIYLVIIRSRIDIATSLSRSVCFCEFDF